MNTPFKTTKTTPTSAIIKPKNCGPVILTAFLPSCKSRAVKIGAVVTSMLTLEACVIFNAVFSARKYSVLANRERIRKYISSFKLNLHLGCSINSVIYAIRKRSQINCTADTDAIKFLLTRNDVPQITTHIIAKAIANKDEMGEISVRKMIGAEVIGMTVCPCAQESVEQESKEKLLEFLDEKTTEKVLEAVTFASHNQRGIGTIMVEVSENQNVNVDDLITIIQNSMSSPVCEILKRPDENRIVTNAHKNPVFVEDCVRNMVLGILEKYSDLPDNSMVTIKQVNEESIHQHNAYAEKVASVGDLKQENNL